MTYIAVLAARFLAFFAFFSLGESLGLLVFCFFTWPLAISLPPSVGDGMIRPRGRWSPGVATVHPHPVDCAWKSARITPWDAALSCRATARGVQCVRAERRSPCVPLNPAMKSILDVQCNPRCGILARPDGGRAHEGAHRSFPSARCCGPWRSPLPARRPVKTREGRRRA